MTHLKTAATLALFITLVIGLRAILMSQADFEPAVATKAASIILGTLFGPFLLVYILELTKHGR